MGSIYVARQPIFNSRMKLYGYELFYRRSDRNVYEGTSDDQATAAVSTDAFFMGFDELIDGTRGFINFSQNLLLNDTPLILPNDKLVIEIVERTVISPELVSACQKLKSLGYKLALDNFVDEEAYGPLIGLADIIKLDYQRTPIAVQSLLIKKYRNATFLAMKVETTDDFKRAERLGYGLFQGYFFNKPVMISIKEIGTLQNNMVQITQKLARPEPDIRAITSIIEKDMELSYKLLRIANSVYYHSLVPITSIQHALVQIGLVELRRWAHLLLIKGLSNTDNAELVKASLVRGKMLALFASATKRIQDESDYFIAGIFSSIDSLLDESMDKILSRLPLTAPVKAALFGTPGPLRDALDAVLAFEKAQWEDVDSFLRASGLPASAFMPMYIRALKWQQSLDI